MLKKLHNKLLKKHTNDYNRMNNLSNKSLQKNWKSFKFQSYTDVLVGDTLVEIV